MTNQLELRPDEEEDLPLLQKLTQDPEATGEFGGVRLVRSGQVAARLGRQRPDRPRRGTLVLVRDF
jgi:hypothetical protein